MSFIGVHLYASPFGELLLGSFRERLCLCDWHYRKMRKSIDDRIKNKLDAEFKATETDIIHETIRQLNQYFDGERKAFDLPLEMAGSPFQQSVWQTLLTVPYGSTETYAGLSDRMHKKDAIRAVASANGANALAVIIPCHRIIGSNGKLIGYAGGLHVKKRLLNLESNNDPAGQLRLFEE